MTPVRVIVEPLPRWLDVCRLLGCEETALAYEALDPTHVRVSAQTSPAAAADIAARLRGVGIDGALLSVRVEPPLSRALVRAARLRDARARRDITPGFTHPAALATGEGRFSLTPEALALSLGREAKGAHVVDACCGSGGNTIGFARAGSQVDAIEIDGGRLAEARRNASLYGVAGRVRFRLGDARALLRELEAEILFVDPPWGERYDKGRTTAASFPLLAAILALDLSRFREVWLKVPASFAVDSVPGASARAWFGAQAGDAQRIKFLLLRSPGAAFGGASR